jgi:hypothetical protein
VTSPSHQGSLARASALILFTFVVTGFGAGDARAQTVDATDCAPPGTAAVIIPEKDVFDPPIVGWGEPRISLAYVRANASYSRFLSPANQTGFAAGIVSAGGIFGFWGQRYGCDSFQFSLTGGVFSQFNLDTPSQELINSDFMIGGQLTHRRDRRSLRVRFYHLSSHLGDEFLLSNPTVDRFDFGFQAIDALFSVDFDPVRLYGGAGARFYAPRSLAPRSLRAGLEMRQDLPFNPRLHGIGGIDLAGYQAADWRPAINAGAGLEWSAPSGSRRVRLLLLLSDGQAYGQFFEQDTVRQIGLQFQAEY